MTNQHPLKRGQAAKYARKVGISPQHFRSIRERRRRVSPALAARLAIVTRVKTAEFINSHTSTDPIFFGPPLPKRGEFWGYGGICGTASAAGISQAKLSNLIYRRERCEPRLAIKLAKITGVAAVEWATNRMSKSPSFYGAPWPTL